MSALNLPQTAEGREDVCKLGGPKAEAHFFVFRATKQTQAQIPSVGEQAGSTFTPQGESFIAFYGVHVFPFPDIVHSHCSMNKD